jgi:hypothetical protein
VAAGEERVGVSGPASGPGSETAVALAGSGSGDPASGGGPVVMR